MMNLTRYHPFGEIDNLFKGFLVRPMGFETDDELHIKMEVVENEKDYVVHAEIPGVKKEDINLDVSGNQISISAEVKREKEEKNGERVLRAERYFGRVSRTFTLAHDIDEAGVQAKYTDGVLQLTLPKKMMTVAKKIAIQ